MLNLVFMISIKHFIDFMSWRNFQRSLFINVSAAMRLDDMPVGN